MNQKIKNLIKDATMLTIITLVSGFLLAMVYQVTKGPIAEQDYKKKMLAYREVFKDANKFDENENTNKIKKESLNILKQRQAEFGKVGIEEVLEVKSTDGKNIGFVATVYSDEGYGGRVKISVGYNTKEKKLNSIKILDAQETAGLGAKISEEDFYGQYSEKTKSPLKLVKGYKNAEDEIVAISGATISSTAVTNSVNAALLILGGANETK